MQQSESIFLSCVFVVAMIVWLGFFVVVVFLTFIVILLIIVFVGVFLH